MTAPLLAVDGLVKHFALSSENWFRRERPTVRAVDGVSFTLGAGETLGLVGESGCGKSTIGKLVLQLIPATAGAVRFEGRDLVDIPAAELRRLRREIQVVFQDPQGSLNPRMSVAEIVLEPLVAQGEKLTPALREYAGDLLERVGLTRAHATRHPHEFSGGQRQRIGIARAIAPKPKLIICDEAVSALDVSIQAQVINLLMDLQDEMGLSYLFIGHDLAVVRHVADRLAVMYLGRIVETGPKHTVYTAPRHPYTQALLASVPVSHPRQRRARVGVRGEIPSPLAPPPGCHFHPRCPFAQDICRNEAPPLREIAADHRVSCHFAETIVPAKG